MRRFFFLLLVTAFIFPNIGFAEVVKPVSAEPAPEEVVVPPPNLFAEHFFMNPDQRLRHKVLEVRGFLFVENTNNKLNSRYAVVTGYGGNVLRTRTLPEVQSLEEAENWIKNTVEAAEYQGVPVYKVPVNMDLESAEFQYWIGQKSFKDPEDAKAEIDAVKKRVESHGFDFEAMVKEAERYLWPPDEGDGSDVKVQPQFISEEKLILKYLDQMHIGEHLWGPFQGTSPGQPFLWQSFGETTWRQTNFEQPNFNSQVGFYTNRLVFKGLRFPLNTINPYLESTISMEAVGEDFKSNVKFFGGLEWRPLAMNPWLVNFRPWGGIAILEWIRNYRFYIQYGVRENIKDEIVGSDNHDLIAGVQIFYEWGTELPPLDQSRPIKFSDYMEQYIWGEYFGNYRYEMTNFSAEEDFDAFIFNSSVILGWKMPGIPLPPNPINEELVIMPYFRFEHVNNTEFSFPFQNRYFLAAGLRWMPFRSYRWKESEWLSKLKVFIEYDGIGRTQHAKQSIDEGGEIRHDLRVGVSASVRRF